MEEWEGVDLEFWGERPWGPWARLQNGPAAAGDLTTTKCQKSIEERGDGGG